MHAHEHDIQPEELASIPIAEAIAAIIAAEGGTVRVAPVSRLRAPDVADTGNPED